VGILELAGSGMCAGYRAFTGAASSFARWRTFSVLATIATPLSAEGFPYDGTSTVLSGELGKSSRTFISTVGATSDLENEPLRRVLVNAAYSFRRRKVIERCCLSRAVNG
jgi:hypothetical protein